MSTDPKEILLLKDFEYTINFEENVKECKKKDAQQNFFFVNRID